MSTPIPPGFVWPSAASMGQKPSATPSVQVSSAATIISQQETATSGSGAPPVSFSVVSSPSALMTSGSLPSSDTLAGSPGPRTIRVEVTFTLTITPGVLTLDPMAPKSLDGEPHPTSDAAFVHTNTKGPAPETTAVFRMYKQESTNHLAIAGGLFGVLAFILLIVLLFAFLRRRNRYGSSRSQAEKGKARSGNKPTTQEAICAALRLRKERNRRTAMLDAQASVLTPADMSEMMHQGNVIAAEHHTRGQHGGHRSMHSSTLLNTAQQPTHMLTRQGNARAYPIAATPSQRYSLSSDSMSTMDNVDLEDISPL